jgi:hypothetical protein
MERDEDEQQVEGEFLFLSLVYTVFRAYPEQVSSPRKNLR